MPMQGVLMTPFDGNKTGSFPVLQRRQMPLAVDLPRLNQKKVDRDVRLWLVFLFGVLVPLAVFLVVLLGNSL